MKVLLSIKPEFALRIFDGSKKYEYRRIIFKRCEVTTIIVYASAPVGKVIGEFEIDGILYDEPENLWAKTKHHAGITEEKFYEYFTNANGGYAIKVKKTKKYKSPFSLDKYMISVPPQSFVYL